MLNYDQPANPGNILKYSACNRVGEFGGYCEYYLLAKICVDANGEFVTDGSGFQFLLNFDVTEGPLVAGDTSGAEIISRQTSPPMT